MQVKAKAQVKTVELEPANAKNQYLVSSNELPLCCPTEDMVVWNSHPRVYLPIEATGTATCPYCGSQFFLTDAAVLPE